MSIRTPASSFTKPADDVSPFTLTTLLPLFMSFLDMTTSPSDSKPSFFNKSTASGDIPVKVSSLSAKSAEGLTISFGVLAPSAILRAPKSSDFPAPVSPVKMFRLSARSISASSMIAKFLT